IRTTIVMSSIDNESRIEVRADERLGRILEHSPARSFRLCPPHMIPPGHELPNPIPKPIAHALGHLLCPKERGGWGWAGAAAEHAAGLCRDLWAESACRGGESAAAREFQDGIADGACEVASGGAQLLIGLCVIHPAIRGECPSCEIDDRRAHERNADADDDEVGRPSERR